MGKATNGKNMFSDFNSNNDRINIRLENFHFFHRPVTGADGEETDSKHIEKPNPFHQLYNWIRYNHADSGSYLVTGYRGAGKSSIVGRLMKELKKDSENSHINYIMLPVNFGQENIDEIEILRIIVKRLYGELLKQHAKLYLFYSLKYNLTYTFLLLCCISSGFAYCTPEGNTRNTDWIFATIFGVLYLILFFIKNPPVIRAVHKLKSLMERLHASMQLEMSQNINLSWKSVFDSLGMGYKKNRNMQPATVQEIEYDLIEVLDLLKEEKNKNRKVIIIFDELDKTDSGKHLEQPEGIPEFEKLSVRPNQKVSSRTRKQEVLGMIANMKFFLSSAKAYFIFIAGREMYEAFQADMSDRDFSISSIFSGVINIESFLTSSRHANNSNLMTEQFVCKQIFPTDIKDIITRSKENKYDKRNILCLKNYYQYRINVVSDCYGDELTAEKNPDLMKRAQRIWGEVMFLYHFVNYLTYISNGSPKKLSLFFEKNVRHKTYLINENKIKPIYHYKNGQWKIDEEPKDVFFLSCGYYTQEKVNFIHYLTYPIIQNIINRSNLYGDKLLVSSSFLISHIFKLHNNGFSWRNLEQTPELLEINKTPEIREYIGSIIDFMNHTHLTTIACGLFHYKFPMRISEEISYHSKISGEVSAMFNFSLDEMQGIKEHYFRLLKHYQTEANITYAQASIYHSLGDIYMLEENYSDAIRSYEICMESVTPMIEEFKKEKRDGTESTNIQLLNYVSFLNRTMLKLGLAHEKRRTDNSAFILYEELIQILKEFSKEGQILFYNMRTLHLALLAQLYVLEKIDTTGIQLSHLMKTRRNFNKIFQYKKNPLIAADFYRKLGDILYYKNQVFYGFFRSYTAKFFYSKSLCLILNISSHQCRDENKKCYNLCNEALNIKKNLDTYSRVNTQEKTLRDNHIYHMALCLEALGHVAMSEYEKTYLLKSSCMKELAEAVKQGAQKINFMPINNIDRALLYYWTASRLYNISCERGLSTKCYREMAYATLTYARRFRGEKMDHPQIFLELIQNIGEHFLISQHRQYEHINLSEVDMLQWIKGLEMFQQLDLEDLSITPDIEELIYIYNTLKLYMYQVLPDKSQNNKEKDLSCFYHLNIMTGKSPCSTLVSTVQNLKLKARFNEQMLSSLLHCNTPEKLEFIQFTDIADYVYGDISDSLVRSTFSEVNEMKGTPHEKDMKFDLLESLITDGLFCLSRMLELVIPLRNTTLFNNSFKANIYLHLLRFTYLYKVLYCYYYYGSNMKDDQLIDDFMDRNRDTIAISHKREKNIHRPYARSLRPAGNFTGRRIIFFQKVIKATRKSNPTNTHLSFLGENAIHYYTKARQMHFQGKSYQETIRNLFFLNDDLNNDTLQFYMALERFDIASGSLHEVENRLKTKYRRSHMYQIDEYFSKMIL